MFRNNLKIAWRSLLKDRQSTILNLIGLSTGLACTLLIYLWVSDELSIDSGRKISRRRVNMSAKIISIFFHSSCWPAIKARY
jgi:hypothetical protein